jgi:hypothetical protein
LPIVAGKLGFRTTEVPVNRIYPSNGIVPTKIIGKKAKFEVFLILIKAAVGVYDLKKCATRKLK